jgi:hypothetical protein
LKQRYLDLLKTQDKAFGYIVRGLANPSEGGGGGGLMIVDGVKVTRDGEEQVVRGLRLGGITSSIFRDLVDASRERTLYSFRGTNTDAVSVIAPNMLFEELEVQRSRDITQRPPLVPSPLVE